MPPVTPTSGMCDRLLIHRCLMHRRLIILAGEILVAVFIGLVLFLRHINPQWLVGGSARKDHLERCGEVFSQQWDINEKKKSSMEVLRPGENGGVCQTTD